MEAKLLWGVIWPPGAGDVQVHGSVSPGMLPETWGCVCCVPATLCCCSQLTWCFVPVTHPSTELEYLSQQQISIATNSPAREIFTIFEVSLFL